jgi:hypothetical protein
LGEECGGGGFASAVDAFDCEEEATWDEGFHGMIWFGPPCDDAQLSAHKTNSPPVS